MRKTRRALALFTAAALSASAFSGLAISANAEDTVVNGILAHTAAAQGGSNAEAKSLDAETHYYNLWGPNGWIATAYSQFTFEDGALPDSADKIVKAELTTMMNCGRGAYDADIAYVPADAVDLSGATADDCTIPILTKNQVTVLSTQKMSTEMTAYTVDATDAVKAMITNNDSSVTFAYGNGAAGGNIYGKGAAEENQPKLTVTVLDPNAVFYKVKVTQVCGDETIATTETTVREGDPFTPDVENSFKKDGYLYTLEGGNETIESVNSDLDITVTYTKSSLDDVSGLPKTFVDENFDSYTSTGTSAQGTEGQQASLGDLILYVGARGSGGDGKTGVSLSEGALQIVSANYATSSRGVSIAIDPAKVTLPAFSELADGTVLEYSFKAKYTDANSTIQMMGITSNETTPGGAVVNDPYLSIANNKNIPTGEWVNVAVSVDKEKNAAIIITDADGKIVSSSTFKAIDDALNKFAFYGGATTVYMDDFKVVQKFADTGVFTATVKDSAEAAVADAAITVDRFKTATGADGSVSFALPKGEYTVVASKPGYEHTKGMMNDDSKTVAIDGDTAESFVLSTMSYDKIPETVTIGGGQAFIAAPKTADPVTTAAFTATVLDQYDIKAEPEEYTLTWSIFPAGSDAADPNVTIDENGIVSVAQGFSAENNIAEYDVTATAVMNNEGLRGQTVKKTLTIGNNDISYYEALDWSQPGGTGNRGSAQNLTSQVSLPDVSSVTMNVQFPNATEGQVTLVLTSNGGNLVGIQLTSDNKITAWTGWSGNSAFNQSGDAGAFANSGVLVENYDKSMIPVTFVIDKKNNAITASCGSTNVSLPFSVAADTLTGVKFGQYRNYGAVNVKDIMVREPDNNYLAISGDTDFAKVGGAEVTRAYALGQSVIVPEETFNWQLFKDGQEIVAQGNASLSEAAYKASFTPTKSGKAAPYYAEYDANGRLTSIKKGAEIDVTAGVPVTVDADAMGTVVMLWGGESGQEPMAAAAVSAEEQVPVETQAPAETQAPEETQAPAETQAPEETQAPAETQAPEETQAPAETQAPEETQAPTETQAPITNAAIYIDQNGVLHVFEGAEPGVYEVRATSNVNAEKTASLDVTIGDFQTFTNDTAVVEGGRAYNLSTDISGLYYLTTAVDSFGDDVINLLSDVKWSSSNEAVAEIEASTGLAANLTCKGAGSTTITATITNGTAVSNITVPVTIADYYIQDVAEGNSTTVDSSTLISDPSIIGYVVTTAKDGKLVKQYTETSVPATVDTTGADEYEVAPIFSVTDITKYKSAYLALPLDTYNFEISEASGKHFDPYVNDQMLANNMLQGGTAVNSIKVNDILVKEGYATINLRDADSDSKAGKVTIVKSPSIVDRVKKVYVLGDSLVCIYANGGDASHNYQTGLGQVLQNYMTDEVEVVDLGNSGVIAEGLAASAITQVAESGKEGDIMILESGYNDRSYTTQDKMRAAVEFMYNEAVEAKVKPIFMTPPASAHDYKADVSWGSVMKSMAEQLSADCIDLGTISYNFFNETYGASFSDVAVYSVYNVSDRLHSTFNGANKLASIVATEMGKLGHSDLVNDAYTYSFTDSNGATITCKAEK